MCRHLVFRMASRQIAAGLQGACMVLLAAVMLVLTAISSSGWCNGPAGRLIIFHAGSLSVPFSQMERQFEALHPEVDIQREAGGSTKMARMISELGKPADIMAAADYLVIDENLIPEKASWNVRFATNRLVLCYTERSRYADQINSGNWFEILARDDVAWGHSDPNLDPCGYRSLMVMQLAEKYYKRPGLYQRLIEGRPVRNVRPKSVELIAMLRTGHLDYAWEYLSVAVQHGLKYLELPDEINLGNPNYDDLYAQARVRVTGKRPGTWIERRGRSCVYGITMIDGAPNREAALAFLEYLFDPEGGLKILAANGQPPIVPCRVSSQEVLHRVPETLRKWVAVDR